MSREFLDFVEDILDGMNKAEMLLEGLAIPNLKRIFGSTMRLYAPWKLLVKR